MQFYDYLCRGARPRFLVLGVVFLGLAGAVFAGAPAYAAGGLVVTPQLVELDSRNRSQVLALANRGTETETYRISVVNYRMDSKGDLHRTDAPA